MLEYFGNDDKNLMVLLVLDVLKQDKNYQKLLKQNVQIRLILDHICFIFVLQLRQNGQFSMKRMLYKQKNVLQDSVAINLDFTG